MATTHPSALLRAPDDAARREMRALFTAEMKIVARQLRREIARSGR